MFLNFILLLAVMKDMSQNHLKPIAALNFHLSLPGTNSISFYWEPFQKVQLCAGFILQFVAVLATLECKVCSHLPHIAIALELLSPVCNREKEEFADWRELLICGSSHWFLLWQGKNRASGKPSFYQVSSETSLRSGDPLLDQGRRQFWEPLYFGDPGIKGRKKKRTKQRHLRKNIAFNEKLIQDFSKGIYKFAQIL